MPMYNPAHPGELILDTIEGLREETKKPFTIEEVAKGLKTTRKTLSAIINGKQSVTAEMAIKLGIAFSTSPEFWLHVQRSYDLAQARRKFKTKGIRIFFKKRKAYFRMEEENDFSGLSKKSRTKGRMSPAS